MPLFSDPAYAAVVRQWSSIGSFTVESAHKFNFVRFGPGSGDYDFSVADQLIQELSSYGYGRQGMAYHTLFWHNRAQLDPWVETLGYQATRQVIREHIDAVHQHYFVGPNAFPIHRIDLVNEAMDDNRILRAPGTAPTQNPWAQAGTAGAGYVNWMVYAYERAQAVFPPDAKLFYNDFGISFGQIDSDPTHLFDPSGVTHLSKADAVYKLVRDHLQPAGLDGIGIQTHFTVPYYVDVSSLRPIIRRFGALGVEVHLSELDVAIDTSGFPPTAGQLQLQADVYEEVFRICAEEPNCTQVTVWGVTDPYSWIPSNALHCPGCVAPLPHDDFGQPKPAYFSIEHVLDTVQRACPR
jgi:endo-1,4-beta-xylanase